MKIFECCGETDNIEIKKILWEDTDEINSLGVIKKNSIIYDFRYWDKDTPKGGICLTEPMLGNLLIYLSNFIPKFCDEAEFKKRLNTEVVTQGTVGKTSFIIHKKIGTLDATQNTRLVVSWTSFNGEAALDIRTWSKELTRYTRGIRIHGDALKDFFETLVEIIDKNAIKVPAVTMTTRKSGNSIDNLINELLFKMDLGFLLNTHTTEAIAEQIRKTMTI